jgi:hypothetical protein
MDSPKPRSKSEKNKLLCALAGAIEAKVAHISIAAISTELAVVTVAETSVAVRRHFFPSRCPLAQDHHTRLTSTTGINSQSATISWPEFI